MSAYSDAVLADSPAGYWRCGEASGNLADSSGNNSTATKGGSPTYGVAGALGASGDNTTAVSVSPGNYFHTDNDVAVLAFGTGDFTIETWLKDPNSDGRNSLRGAGSGVDGWRFGIDADKKLKFTLGDPTSYIENVVSGAIADTTIWHHCAITFDRNGVATGYIDGQATGVTVDISARSGSVSGVSPCPLEIGSWRGGCTTTFQEFAVYPSVLSATRIATHYAAAIPAVYTLGVMTPTYVSGLRDKLSAGTDPWATSWTWFLDNHVAYAVSDTPDVFAGPATDSGTQSTMFTKMREDGNRMRTLAIAYAATGTESYATKTRDFLMAWAAGNTPTTAADYADIYTLMYQGTGFFPFAYAYDLTQGSDAYSAGDRVALLSYFQTAVDALMGLVSWYAGAEYMWTHPASVSPYEWVPNTNNFEYHPHDRVIGGDILGEGTVGALALSIMCGDDATKSRLLGGAEDFAVQNQIHHACVPNNDGDGVAGHPNPVPQACIHKPGAGDNSGNGGPIDYFTFSSMNHVLMTIMAQAQGVDMTTQVAELDTTYDYISLFYEPNGEPSPAPNDYINYGAGIPRIILAYSLFPTNARLKEIAQRTNVVNYKGLCLEPQFVGPTTLTFWPLDAPDLVDNTTPVKGKGHFPVLSRVCRGMQ